MRGPNLDKLKNWGIFTLISAIAGMIENGFFNSRYFIIIALTNAFSFGAFAYRIATNPEKIEGEDD